MLYRRTLIREMGLTAGAVLTVLIAIALVILFIRLLGDVARGELANEAVFAFLGFSLLYFLPVLLTIALGLGRDVDGEAVGVQRHGGETHAVDRDAVADGNVGKVQPAAGDDHARIGAARFVFVDAAYGLNDAGKHAVSRPASETRHCRRLDGAGEPRRRLNGAE